MLNRLKSVFHGDLLVFCAGAVLIGLAAMLLSRSAGLAFHLFERLQTHWWWPFLSLPLGGMALVWFIRKVGPGTEGSGIQQAVAALEVASSSEKVGLLVNMRLAAAKFVAIVGGLGSGFVLGLEGPTVQIGAAAMYSLRRFLPQNSKVARKQLITAGGAAGIAAAFSAPMAGIMFAVEELSHSVDRHTSAKVMLAVALAGAVPMFLDEKNSYFGHITLLRHDPLELILILLLVAAAGGALGGLFSWLSIYSHRWLPSKIRRIQACRPYLFVVLCGLFIAVCGLGAPVFGSGAERATMALNGEFTPEWQYVPLKFAAFLATTLTGLPGGIFAPSLSLGVGLGSLLSFLGDPVWQAEIMCAGMVAVLAGVTRAPLTAAFIVIEMTDGHVMILEALLVALIAGTLARRFHTRYYHELARRALREISAK